MNRHLSLTKEVVAELSYDELGEVRGAAVSILGMCVDLSRADCGIPTCGYTCTNTSTAFKG